MVEVEVLLKTVECSKFSEKSDESSEVTFDVNASLSETERNPGWLALKFDIRVETQPSLAKLSVAGSAIVRGSKDEIQSLMTPRDQNAVPPVFMKIYQNVYAILYLLAGSLSIPHPAPGLLKTTRLYSSPTELAPAVKPTELAPSVEA